MRFRMVGFGVGFGVVGWFEKMTLGLMWLLWIVRTAVCAAPFVRSADVAAHSTGGNLLLHFLARARSRGSVFVVCHGAKMRGPFRIE